MLAQDTTVIRAAAARLAQAAADRTACAPVRDVLGTEDLVAAYRVQQELVALRAARGEHPVGWKIGLTSPAVQRQLGVDRPDFGVLLDSMAVPEGEEISSGSLIQPKIEAEIAFVLRADLAADDLNVDAVRHAVDHAVAALEIVDSRVQDWDITITDTVADNASSALFTLASTRLTLDDFVPRDVSMRLYVDDALVSEGNGAACLGDPLNALLWLAETARDLGSPLRAGDVVLSGALGPMVAVTPGTTVRAEISDLGSVSVAFSKE